jgi:uncharacterized protein YoxC
MKTFSEHMSQFDLFCISIFEEHGKIFKGGSTIEKLFNSVNDLPEAAKKLSDKAISQTDKILQEAKQNPEINITELSRALNQIFQKHFHSHLK